MIWHKTHPSHAASIDVLRLVALSFLYVEYMLRSVYKQTVWFIPYTHTQTRSPVLVDCAIKHKTLNRWNEKRLDSLYMWLYD